MHTEDIKAELRKAGISMAEIARRLGVSRAAVSAVVDGLSRSQRVEAAVAQALARPPAQLWPAWYGHAPAGEAAHAQGHTAETIAPYQTAPPAGSSMTGHIHLPVLRATLRACGAALKRRFALRAMPDPEYLALVYNRIARLESLFAADDHNTAPSVARFESVARQVLDELLPDGDEPIAKVATPW